MQGVIPMLSYEDGIAAMEWLQNAFGFREISRFIDDDGKLSHGEMETGSGLIMLATPTPDYESPKRHRLNCRQAAKWSEVPWVIDGVQVYVKSVDEHFERTKRCGANILSEPEDRPPVRRYRVEDLEGHRWMFVEKEKI